jgi:putative addiction module component (TIGR02574 family)
MNTEFEPLFKLSRAERLQLVEDLWDSLVQEDAELSVSEEKRAELRRRKERYLQHPSSGSSGRGRSMIERVIFTPDADDDVAGHSATS